MGGDGAPTRADVEPVGAWTGPSGFDPLTDEGSHRTYSDGRIIIQAPGAQAAREIEEVARAQEEMHGEQRETLLRAVREALARGVAAGPGPWAVGTPSSGKGREELRRAGFEERHDGELGTVWVRPADGEPVKPRGAPFVVPVGLDPRGRSG